MKKFLTPCILTLFITFMYSPIALALEIMPAGEYTTPDDWSVIAEYGPVSLEHTFYYTWGCTDLAYTPEAVSIVFHDISNSAIEKTWLSVYLFDQGTTGFRVSGKDDQSTSSPDDYPWQPVNLVDGVWIYDWSDGESFDVIYTTTNPTLLTYLGNGNTFRLGIDPDCHFKASSITIETTNAPVPEPTTLLLLGSGLLGLAGLRRKWTD